MRTLVVILLLLFALPVLAFVAVEPTFPEAYEPHIVTSDFYTKTTYLGELTGDAQLYAVTVDVADTLPLTLLQAAKQESQPFGILVVEVLEDGRGVREVARHIVPVGEWSREKDQRLGVTLLTAPTLEVALASGVYLVEVSTPDNFGAYALSIGVDDVSEGYWPTLGSIRATQKHFNYSFLRMLASSYVYWPLGVGFFVLVFYKLYRLSARP